MLDGAGDHLLDDVFVWLERSHHGMVTRAAFLCLGPLEGQQLQLFEAVLHRQPELRR